MAIAGLADRQWAHRREAFTSENAECIILQYSFGKAMSGSIEMKDAHDKPVHASGRNLSFSGALDNGLQYAAALTVIATGGEISAEESTLRSGVPKHYARHFAPRSEPDHGKIPAYFCWHCFHSMHPKPLMIYLQIYFCFFLSILENSEGALAAMSAYIDLNPVRAGIVKDPKDYRFCGYGEAVSRGGRAADGIRRLAELLDDDSSSTARALKSYRKHLYMDDRGRSLSAEETAEVLASGGALSLHQILRCRVRYFSDGLVLGGRLFVEEVYQVNRGLFGDKRRSGPRPLRHGEWQGLCALRDLRLDVIIAPCS